MPCNTMDIRNSSKFDGCCPLPLLTSLIALGLLFIPICTWAQHTFRVNSVAGQQIIWVNSEAYLTDSASIEIATNYPDFDTLVLPLTKIKILVNFKPDSSYSIVPACCAEHDIIPKSKVQQHFIFNFDTAEHTINDLHATMDKPFISIRTSTKTDDTIYAWHADWACLTQQSALDTVPWRLGVPTKCFYWSNTTAILFFKIDNRMPIHEKTDLEVFLGRTNLVELTTIHFRLFDDQRFILTFEEKSNTAKLEYE
ncbi:MAG: hypothetical protein R3A43_01755 [Bacteroidia bacterium]